MRKKVLFVDDEHKILKAIIRIFRNEPYEIVTSDNPVKVLNEIEDIRPAAVISDQRMPGMEGTVFLEKIREILPSAVRIILTGHPDYEAAIAAINNGHVYRFITKPWDTAKLKIAVEDALEYHELMSRKYAIESQGLEEKRLQQERFQGVVELAGAVCHELNQPIQVASVYTQMLLMELQKTDPLYVKIADINKQVDKIAKVTKKIMSITRYETCNYVGDISIVDIDKASEETHGKFDY